MTNDETLPDGLSERAFPPRVLEGKKILLWRPPSSKPRYADAGEGQRGSLPPQAGSASKVMVTDKQDEALQLMLMGNEGRVVAVPLSPSDALGIATELLVAAAHRLG